MSSKGLVLVTGVSGFVGSHVAFHLLNSGYSVRGTARGPKLEVLRTSLGSNYPSLELVQLDDTATGDLTDALKGVYAIIHVASPLAGVGTAKETLTSAVEGTLNILRQALKAGINKVVVTSSWAATLDPTLAQSFEDKVFTEKDWGNATEEEALSGKHDIMWVYFASKILAEAAAWKFADEHPSLDLATINPPFIYGPLVPHFPLSPAKAPGTNKLLRSLLAGKVPSPIPPFFCDARDVARAHVAALDVPRRSPLQSKRFLVSGGIYTWRDAAEYLAQARPELAAGLPSLDAFPPNPVTLASIDATRAREVLGLDQCVHWKKTVLDTVDSLLAAERNSVVSFHSHI